jgi:hypothetical protein
MHPLALLEMPGAQFPSGDRLPSQAAGLEGQPVLSLDFQGAEDSGAGLGEKDPAA